VETTRDVSVDVPLDVTLDVPLEVPAHVADDPVGEAVRDALREVLFKSKVEVTYSPPGVEPEVPAPSVGTAHAVGPGPDGWQAVITVRLAEKVARLIRAGEGRSLTELVRVLPGAGARVAAQLRDRGAGPDRVPPALRRAMRDLVAAEILTTYLQSRLGTPVDHDLVPDTIEYLVELSGTRVEAHELTHGVVITDVLQDAPRLELPYPAGLYQAKRAPLLFDGQRSVLIVDPRGRARTELQRHRFTRLAPASDRPMTGDGDDSGSLVAEATRALRGIGFYVRGDRSIWTFVDGQPLLVRRGEHWTAFPVELTALIASMIGGGAAAELVARAAFMISAQPHGAILAIVEDADTLAGAVALKDRYDLRSSIAPADMRPETWLHHLIDAERLDERTLARLATLDGATVVDRDGGLLAYGAIVTSAGSEHEGARTAAARTLSETAQVVLKVSVDGDITVFRDGAPVTTLLGTPATILPRR
jgi:hypothetical protein